MPISTSMGIHIKTTIELSDALFHSAKELASKSQTTMRALVEEGLRRVLDDAQTKTQPAIKFKDASVRGGEMLISAPRKWQKLEDEYLTSRLVIPAKAGTH
jgi:predicted transcriptional regulator